MKKKYIYLVSLIILVGCNKNVLQLIKDSQKESYTKEQLDSNFTKTLIKYQSDIRDTIFNANNLGNIKSFQLIENVHSYNGNFSGCFLSKDKTIGFYKDSYLDKLEYTDICGYDDVIKHVESTDQKKLVELSDKFPSFESGKIFYYRFWNKNVSMKSFNEFDFEILSDSINIK